MTSGRCRYLWIAWITNRMGAHSLTKIFDLLYAPYSVLQFNVLRYRPPRMRPPGVIVPPGEPDTPDQGQGTKNGSPAMRRGRLAAGARMLALSLPDPA
jgi:hypothetical protein